MLTFPLAMTACAGNPAGAQTNELTTTALES